MLEQTKRAVKAMKSCGFDRSSFIARTDYDRKTMSYGRAKVTFLTDNAANRAFEKGRELAATGDLNVEKMWWKGLDGEVCGFVLVRSGSGKYEEFEIG